MNQPKISIVLVTYNRANYIGETIASIIAQTYTNWELLIIDNGSDDNTESIIKRLGESRIVYEKTARMKMGTSKNVALRKASGHFIAFMDDDDLWMNDKLEKQIKALQDYSNAGFSYTNGYNFQNNDEFIEFILKERTGFEYGNIFQSYCKGARGVFIQSVMCRRECIEVAGYFDEDFFFTDYTFIGNLAYHFDTIILREPLFRRRLHKANSILYLSSELVAEQIDAIRKYVKRKWLPASVARESIFLTYVKTGNFLAAEHKFASAFGSYLHAWAILPFSIIPPKKLLRLFYTNITR